MPVPKRIVVVDDDTKVRKLIEYRLRAPEFEFFGFSDGRDALMKLHDIAPDLIVSDIMMPDMDGRLFFQVVKRSAVLKNVPFLFVSAVRADADVMAALDAGADAFLVKPFPISQLVAKIRNTLGMGQGAAAEAGASTVAGRLAMGVTPLPDEGTPPPQSPSESIPQAPSPGAPATPLSAAEVPSADALEAAAPSTPPAQSAAADASVSHGDDNVLPQTSSDDFFDMLLTAQASGEPKPMRIVEGPGRGSAGLPPPEGRFSNVDVDGRRVQIRTEVRSRPTFVVVTTVSRGGRTLRRIETAWEHPLDRVEDRGLVTGQIELQHRQAIDMVEALVVEATPRRVFWGSQERSVDASVLCRAMTLVSEQLRAYIGSQAVLGLLRRSHGATAQDRRILRSFHIRNDGIVWCDRGATSVPHEGVAAVAAWASELLADAARSSERARDLRVRQLTRPMSEELERLGFYGAFEGLTEGAVGRARWAGPREYGTPRTV